MEGKKDEEMAERKKGTIDYPDYIFRCSGKGRHILPPEGSEILLNNTYKM